MEKENYCICTRIQIKTCQRYFLLSALTIWVLFSVQLILSFAFLRIIYLRTISQVAIKHRTFMRYVENLFQTTLRTKYRNARTKVTVRRLKLNFNFHTKCIVKWNKNESLMVFLFHSFKWKKTSFNDLTMSTSAWLEEFLWL